MGATTGLWRDFFVTPAPDNPPVGVVREYADRATGLFKIIGPSGAPALASSSIANPTPDWFNVKNYGAKGDAQKVTDAASSAGNTITSTTANFKQSDVGKICWGIENASGLARVAQGVIASVDSATACHVTTASFSNGYSNLTFVWGTDDTAALQAACAAAIPPYTSGISNTTQLGTSASTIYCPHGGYLFSSLPFDFAKQGYDFAGPNILGDGPTSTFFYPTPSYHFTSTYANKGMLVASGFNAGNSTAGFTLDGSNFGYAGATDYYGAELTGHAVRDIVVLGFNGIGAAVRSNTSFVENCISVGNNVTGWLFVFGQCTVVGGLFSNSAPFSARVLSFNNVPDSGSISFHGTMFDEPGLSVEDSQNVSLHGCIVYGGPCLTVDGTSSVFLYGGSVGPFGAPTNATGLKILSGGYCAAFGTRLYGRGTGYAVDNAGTFVDGGGNQITNATSSNLVNGGSVQSFSNTTAPSAGAIAGYTLVNINGTPQKMPYYAVS